MIETIPMPTIALGVDTLLYQSKPLNCILHPNITKITFHFGHQILKFSLQMPGKKDDVSFAVTRLDMERGVAVGIITDHPVGPVIL